MSRKKNSIFWYLSLPVNIVFAKLFSNSIISLSVSFSLWASVLFDQTHGLYSKKNQDWKVLFQLLYYFVYMLASAIMQKDDRVFWFPACLFVVLTREDGNLHEPGSMLVLTADYYHSNNRIPWQRKNMFPRIHLNLPKLLTNPLHIMFRKLLNVRLPSYLPAATTVYAVSLRQVVGASEIPSCVNKNS